MAKSRSKFNVLVPELSVTVPEGREWKKVFTSTTQKKAEEKVKQLQSLGVTELRMTKVTTNVLLDTSKG